MVADMIRDSFFGHIIRLVSRNKAFQYPEEKDISVAERYYNTEKTKNIARYGQTTVSDDQNKENKSKDETDSEPKSNAAPDRAGSDSDDSQSTRVDMNRQVSNVTGTPVDPEKGRDLTIVDWDGPNDPEVNSRDLHCHVTLR